MKVSQPNITQHEIDAVVNALKDGHLATGKCVEAFEQAFIDKFGYEYVVAVNSGTSALIMSLTAMGIKPGDEVIVTAYSIMATVNCILAVGATPVFCDVERDTYNLDPLKLRDLITSKTRAILPASIFGVPCDVPGIKTHCEGLPILEDAIEALGAERDGTPVGSDVYAATFGFYPNKQITTCQGGVVVTQDGDFAAQIRALRQHGYVENGDLWNQAYGWNTRLPDPLAAMGTVQLSRLDSMQEHLDVIAKKMDEKFLSYRRQKARPYDKTSHFIYGIELPEGVNKRLFCEVMGLCDVPVRPYFPAMHRMAHVAQYYRECPVADKISECTVALPFHHDITDQDIEMIWTTFRELVL